jgi:hypothetical protein
MGSPDVLSWRVRDCARRLAAGGVRLPEELRMVARDLAWAAELTERQRRVRAWRGMPDQGRGSASPDAAMELRVRQPRH